MHAWLKFEGYSSKNEAATPLRSSKLKWAWRAQFLSHNLQILWKFIFFESLQMIVKPSLAISNSIEFGKKWSSPPSMCKGVLGLSWPELHYEYLKNLSQGTYTRARVSTVVRKLQKELTGCWYMQMDEL